MIAAILVLHVFIAVALIGSILIQRSEGGALGVGGGSMGGLMTARGSASLLTRVTAGLGVCFFTTSIVLAILAGGTQTQRSIIDPQSTTAPAPIQPILPQGPQVPLN